LDQALKAGVSFAPLKASRKKKQLLSFNDAIRLTDYFLNQNTDLHTKKYSFYNDTQCVFVYNFHILK